MDKKGFTLIELLAVIVILAIIAVIAIPRILNVVEEAKKGAAEASALGYIDAVEKQIMINATSHSHDEITDNTYPIPLDPKYGVTVKGKAPDSGEIVIENGKVKTYSIVVDGYTISYDGTNKSVTKLGEVAEVCTDYEENEVVLEESTTGAYTFKPKCTGRYKLEAWGAQGGNAQSIEVSPGGYGSYSIGETTLNKNETIYIYVGGKGSEQYYSNSLSKLDGGFNGGGCAYGTSVTGYRSSGGGATHISKEDGELANLSNKISSILIVAGGGGGSGLYRVDNDRGNGGAGGGKNGIDGQKENSYTSQGYGASQESGGLGPNAETVGSFGKGGDAVLTVSSIDSRNLGGSGGGGGFYGGGASFNNSGAGGGSGYIKGLDNAKMVMYGTGNTYVSNDTETKTELTNQYSETAESNKAKKGNGAVKITYLG